MYPISDLTAFCRRTTGDVPPKLVGASTTVVGSKMYLYGGRLVSERRMVADIYMFDLETFHWDKLFQHPEDDAPQPRYFHSADTWKNHLIIFGGMAIKPQSENPEDLCVLNDVRLFDLTTGHWLPPSFAEGEASSGSFIPNARYAHLSSVTADRLFIIGGQDLANVWLDDVYIYDLVAKAWVQRRDYSRHCGTYRSVAVTGDMRVRLPQEEHTNQPSSSKIGAPGTRFKLNKSATPTPGVTPSESLTHLPYSAVPTDEYPCDIFLFSNYNFTDVQRELEVFTPLSDADFTISDRSDSMTGTSFPPGLRFPTGAILGTFFIVAGTYLSQTYQSFSIWALDLINMTWSRIDPGSALATGSWFRSCLWPAANKFLVFGNRHGNLVEDYNRRLLSWDHVTCIDLEAFGIYQPPPLILDPHMQELGLAAFEEGMLADFDIVCDDGRKVKCSRRLLEERWPWFKEQRQRFVDAAVRAVDSMPTIAQHVQLAALPGMSSRAEPRPDPRLTPRSFVLSEPYPVTLALVQYLYSTALVTPLQHAPAVLSQLLLLATTYELEHLQSLVKHAMHRALSYATSVGIYGVSTLCSCRSLQIRALRVVMAYSQKRPAGGRQRPDKDASAGPRHPDSSSGGPGPGRSGPGDGPTDGSTPARPRGMSDASYLRGPSENISAGSSQGYANGLVIKAAADASETASLVTIRPRAMSATLYREQSTSPAFHSRDPSAEGPWARATPAWRRDVSYRERPFSIVSLSTDQELRDIADMMSAADPDVHVDVAEVDESADNTPTTEEPHALSDNVVRTMLEEQRSDDAHSACASNSISHSHSRSSSSTSFSAPSHSSDYVSDTFCDSAILSPTTAAFPVYHLPRARSATWDSDMPSLSSSTSYSSLSTPSLSRKSSFAASPPVSPTTSTPLITPTDLAFAPPTPPKLLGAIAEARALEDSEAGDVPWGAEPRVRDLQEAHAAAAVPAVAASPARPRAKSHSGAVFTRLFSSSALNLSLAKAEERRRQKEAARQQQRRAADAAKALGRPDPVMGLMRAAF